MKSKKLTVPPNSFGDQNKWADYIEILCLTSEDKIVTADDIYDKIYGDKSDDESDDYLDDEWSDEIDLDNEPNMSHSEKEDRNKTKINDVFEFLISRVSLFNDLYPFKLSRSPSYLEIDNKLSFKQYSYLGLLISSNLDYFAKYRPKLTTSFEKNSVFVFKKLFPENANIEYFGKGSDRDNRFNANKLSDRLKQLSAVLKIPLSPDFDENEINNSNTGDGGLDLVGWFDIMDDNSGKIINFGQCACGKEWSDKQFDIHPAKWNNFLHLNQPIIRTLITPSSFRKYSGEWFKKMKIYDCIVIDRLRFLKSLRKKENSKVANSNFTIVEEIIGWNLDYFN